jgi:hypothetical protein
MTDTIRVRRAQATGVVRLSDEEIGDAAVKNIHKLLTAESVATITEYGHQYGFRTSIIEFEKEALTITHDGGGSDNGWGALKLATFPEGRIWVFGAVGTLSSVDVSDSANVADAGSGDYSFGTAQTENATLDSSAVDLGPSAALIDPFASGVGSANASSVLASAALFDGTGTAKTINLNIVFDNGDVTTGDGSADIAGKLVLKWAYLADF